VGGIAHDLNNILAPVIFGTQMLRDAVNSAEATRTLATMESSAKRGAAIVSQLLSFSRGGVKGHEPVQLTLIVRDMCAIMRETFPKNITARAVQPPEVWTVLGNPTQFHQILMNLCVNACDAMPAGGTLSIALENVQLDGAFAAKVPGVTPGPHVLLSVTDTGVGIAPEVVGKIFDPFFTTKDVGEGTGLGLSTVLGIATSHGGVVQVTSQIGVGTQFRVYLPAVPKSLAPADPAAVAAPSRSRRNGPVRRGRGGRPWDGPKDSRKTQLPGRGSSRWARSTRLLRRARPGDRNCDYRSADAGPRRTVVHSRTAPHQSVRASHCYQRQYGRRFVPAGRKGPGAGVPDQAVHGGRIVDLPQPRFAPTSWLEFVNPPNAISARYLQCK
jgi:hypothetical protein